MLERGIPMKRILLLGALALAGSAWGKLPPLSDDAKAKAAETAARNAYNDKVGAFQLCKSMDRIAAKYHADAKKAGKDIKPAETAPCADPGAFAYTPPAAKPLETSGAHSPPGTAGSPPSTGSPAPPAAAAAPATKP
jgi:hypothetical protein